MANVPKPIKLEKATIGGLKSKVVTTVQAQCVAITSEGDEKNPPVEFVICAATNEALQKAVDKMPFWPKGKKLDPKLIYSVAIVKTKELVLEDDL